MKYNVEMVSSTFNISKRRSSAPPGNKSASANTPETKRRLALAKIKLKALNFINRGNKNERSGIVMQTNNIYVFFFLLLFIFFILGI